MGRRQKKKKSKQDARMPGAAVSTASSQQTPTSKATPSSSAASSGLLPSTFNADKKKPSISTTAKVEVVLVEEQLEALLRNLAEMETPAPDEKDDIRFDAHYDDRLVRRLVLLYDDLLQLGFSEEQVQQVMAGQFQKGKWNPSSDNNTPSALQSAALDWLCLHVPVRDLPALFQQDQHHATSAVADNTFAGESLTVVAATPTSSSGADQAERRHENTVALPQPAVNAQSSALGSEKEEEKLSTDELEQQKAWLLEQYQYVSDDDEPEEETAGSSTKLVLPAKKQEAVSERNEDQVAKADNVDESFLGSTSVLEHEQEELNEQEEKELRRARQQEEQLATLEDELKTCQADLNDEANNYFRSKQEIKDLKKHVGNLQNQIRKFRQKMNQNRPKDDAEQQSSGGMDEQPEDESGGAGDDEGLFGMFDEDEEQVAATKDGKAPPTENTTGTTTVDEEVNEDERIPADSVPKSWTGQTPKEILQDYCRKNKLPRPRFEELPRRGCRIRVSTTKSGSESLTLERPGPVVTFADAQQFLATKALYHLQKDLPLYRLFPPFYRQLWQKWMDEEKRQRQEEDEDAQLRDKEEYDRRRKLVENLIEQTVAHETAKSVDGASPHEAENKSESEAGKESWEDGYDSVESELMQTLPTAQKTLQQTTAADDRGRSLQQQFAKIQASSQYQAMLKQRQELPVYSFRQEILDTIEKNPVTVICAETGAGKSTNCPQFVLEQALMDGMASRTSILCTQPRRVAAMSLSERVSEEMGEKSVGGRVGYQIRLEARRSRDTKLLFCTTGVVLRRLMDDPTLNGISHVVVDEVHERQWQIDMLLVVLRDLLNGPRPDLKVILMSATLDAKLFCSFFHGAPLVNVPGRTFPVSTYYLEDLMDATDHMIEEGSPYAKREYAGRETTSIWITTRGGEKRKETLSLDSEVDVEVSDEYAGYKMTTRRSMDRVDESKINYDLIQDVLELLLVKNDPDCQLQPPDGNDILGGGSILVFLPGLGEIRTLSERLEASTLFRKPNRFVCIPLHSRLSSNDQKRAFQNAPNGCRKIILSTNIAETSVTIPDVVCVLDCGRVREIRRDRKTSTSKLMVEWCSRASTKQRAGRAGRVQPGMCLKLFSERTESKVMKPRTDPELTRIPLEEVCLNVLSTGFSTSCSKFLSNTPQPPSEDAVRAALDVLSEIGAVLVLKSSNQQTEKLTSLGRNLAKLPVDVRVGKMLIYGSLFRCIDPITCIAASLSASQSVFVSTLYDDPRAKAARKSFSNPRSDFLTFVNVWEAFQNCPNPRKFCKENFLSYRALKEIGDARQLYLDLLSGLGFLDRSECGYIASTRRYDEKRLSACAYNVGARHEELVHATVCSGMYPNIACLSESDKDRTLWHKQEQLFIHSSSVNSKLPSSVPSSLMAFHEKFGTAHRVSVSTTCFLHPFSVILFGGSLAVQHLDRKVIIDDWIEINVAAKTAVLLRELRKHLDRLLATVIDVREAKTGRSDVNTLTMVDTIIQVLESHKARSYQTLL